MGRWTPSAARPFDTSGHLGVRFGHGPSSGVRRAGLAAAVAAAPLLLAYRFAQVYRVRAGFPHRHEPLWAPDALGMAHEEVRVPSTGGLLLPGWFMPAGQDAAPGIVLIHGWESARDRTLPHAQFLHAAGFHVLAIDVRGHGRSEAEAAQSAWASSQPMRLQRSAGWPPDPR
ncbi:MAG: alpha/beta hydrolase [Chloroflexota bacterium]